jgi:hypothetical protein
VSGYASQQNSQPYEFVLPPRVVQFRLDLRLIAARLKGFFGCRVSLPALALSSRLLLGVGELLMISVIMRLASRCRRRTTFIARPSWDYLPTCWWCR